MKNRVVIIQLILKIILIILFLCVELIIICKGLQIKDILLFELYLGIKLEVQILESILMKLELIGFY